MNVLWASPETRSATPGQGTMRAIATMVAERHGLSLKDLTGPDRRRAVAHPRQEAYALIYQTGRFSTPQIGRFFGGRDHATILDGLRAYRARLEEARARQAA